MIKNATVQSLKAKPTGGIKSMTPRAKTAFAAQRNGGTVNIR
jgi:hypothetical protein